MSQPSYNAVGPKCGEHDYTRCKCMRCLEAWLFYGNPPPRPFNLRQKVTITDPFAKRIAHRGTVYRAYYDLDSCQWIIGVKTATPRLYVTYAKHIALDKTVNS
jgi:hypothetical protein